MANSNIPQPKTVEDGKYECPMCGKTFHTTDIYEIHARNNHQQQIGPATSDRERKEKSKEKANTTESRTNFTCTTLPT